MSRPRVQTHFSQARHHHGPETSSSQPRTYSWVATPVEMSGRRHQQSAPESIPPLPAVPESLRQAPEPAYTQTEPEYPKDYKIDESNMGTYPSHFTPYADATPIKQTPDPQTQWRMTTVNHVPQPQAQWRTTPMPPSPGPLPNKADLASSHEPPGSERIAPDENPLTPKSPSHSQHSSKLATYPPRAAARPDGYHNGNNHYPGQAPDLVQLIKGGTWNHGLCDCADIGTCCTGLFCPCILYGKTQYRLTQKSDRKDPTNMLGYEMLNGSCMSFAVLCGCNFILAAIQHTRVRKNYGIPGSVGSDCVRAVCCCCCTLAQDEKEIKYRESHRSDFVESRAITQYAAPGGMSYASPLK
jgi:Cys-rich protein (TIGR01571 family)